VAAADADDEPVLAMAKAVARRDGKATGAVRDGFEKYLPIRTPFSVTLRWRPWTPVSTRIRRGRAGTDCPGHGERTTPRHA
jgi:hypothetical protein